jgi:hypothetical protein
VPHTIYAMVAAIKRVEDDVKRHPEDPIIRFLLSVSLPLILGLSRMDGVARHCVMQGHYTGYSSCEIM